MKLEFKLDKSGWADLTIDALSTCLSVRVSWLTDTPTQLLNACCEVLLQEGAARFYCVEEPGEHRFILRREGSTIRIQVMYFAILYSERRSDEEGIEIASLSGDLREFLESVAGTMRSLYTSMSPDEYLRRWCRAYPFPVAALLNLERLIDEELKLS